MLSRVEESDAGTREADLGYSSQAKPSDYNVADPFEMIPKLTILATRE